MRQQKRSNRNIQVIQNKAEKKKMRQREKLKDSWFKSPILIIQNKCNVKLNVNGKQLKVRDCQNEQKNNTELYAVCNKHNLNMKTQV